MMPIKKTLLLGLILLQVASGSVLGAGKVTIDPNTSSATDKLQEWDSDPRLSQKVTYEAQHNAVKVILDELSVLTGITLNAGYNKNDWQVRDRKMNIFAKDITLADLMNSIARVMKFKWSINKAEVPWTYRLYMDRETLTSANAELSKSQEEFDQEINRRRENFINMFENWDDDLSSDELEDLKNDNPYLYLLHTQGIGALMQGLMKDIPSFKGKFLSKINDMGPKISLLSPETQEALLNAAKLTFQVKDDGVTGSGGEFPEDCEKAFSKGSMLLDISPDELGWKSFEYSKLAGMGLYINDRFFNLNSYMGDPSDPYVQAFAMNALQAIEKGVSLQQAWDQGENRPLTNLEETKMLEKYFPTEPQPDIPDEPDLHIKIKVRPEHKKNRSVCLVDFEATVAKASGFAVVSDSYKTTFGCPAVSGSETELKDVLNAIGEGYRYNWDKHKSIIEFRSKEWFKKRTTQIPDEWIDKWKADLKKLGYMSIDNGAQIAVLTTLQIEENIYPDSVLSKSGMFRDGSKDIWLMRLYASLSSTQRKDLFSGFGLNTLSFSADQWLLLRRVFESGFDPKTFVGLLHCVRTPPNLYAFTMFNAKTNTLLEKWSVRTLEYKDSTKPDPTNEPKKT